MLQLKKPLAFIDLETTGVNPGTDRIVEIAIVKILTDGTRNVKRKLLNPEMPIPKGASDIHGIIDDMIKDAPTFKQVAHELKQVLDGCDFAGYNSNRFDIPLLMEEFLRAQVDFDMNNRKLLDVQNIFHKMEQRTLSAAYQFYCNKSLVNAHTAEADTMATFEVLSAQLDRYEILKNDIDFLSELSSISKNVDLAGRIVFNEKGEEVFNFGKYKGRKVQEIFSTEPSYYDWMMKGDFASNTKTVITQLRLKDFKK